MQNLHPLQMSQAGPKWLEGDQQQPSPEDSNRQTFSRITLRDHVKAHLGNQHHNYYGPVQQNTVCPDANERDHASAVKKCRNEIFLTDPELHRASLISTKGKRVEGTCEWIRADETYKSWRNGEEQVLWIRGGPGKGKTMLSIFLSQDLEEAGQTIYYFCANDDQQRNNAAAVLRALIWQVTGKYPESTGHLLEYLDDQKKIQSTLSSPDALWHILIKVMQDRHVDQTFCVLDGLDELDEDSQIWLVAKLVDEAQTPVLHKLKLVAVSRPILRLESVAKVSLDPEQDEHMTRDNKIFIRAKVDELAKVIELDAEFREMVEDMLTQRAEGTFLWVGFAMAELFRQKNATNIKDSLAKLPRDLPGIYRRILLQIAHEFRKVGLLLLRWVVTALSPLSLPELAAAIGTQASRGISVKQAILDQVDNCGPMLTIRDGKVGLVHQSAKDYLMRTGGEYDDALEIFWMNEEECHQELTSQCLSCMQQSRLLYQSISMSELHRLGFGNQGPGHSPLLWYAISSWPQHARLSSKTASYLTEHTSFFDDGSALQQEWWKMYVTQERYSLFDMSALHIACYLGIRPWVERLVGNGKVNTRNSDGWTPLYAAAFKGHGEVVRLLIDRGAEVTVANKDGWTPLHEAASRGHLKVAEILLGTGTDPAVTSHTGKSPLWLAASNGHVEVARLLVKDTDLESASEDGWTPLFAAARNLHLEAMRLLLDQGADPATTNKDGWTPLHEAAFHGQPGVAQLLLDKRANLDVRNSLGWTPLHAAAWKGHSEMVRLLLGKGADPTVTNEDGATPLHDAAFHGHLDVVKMLLNDRADPNVTNKDGATPLHEAAFHGHSDTAMLLLGNGADLAVKNRSGYTPLYVAAQRGHLEVMQRLFERDA